MTSSIGGVTADIVGYALDGLTLRHSAIASNIANAGTPGYRPLEVNFEAQLAAAAGGMRQNASVGMALAAPRLSEAALPSSLVTQRGVEAEVVKLNQNVVQYQALIRGYEKYMSAMSIAINEGRR